MEIAKYPPVDKQKSLWQKLKEMMMLFKRMDQHFK
jgi:hypothetical protein